MSGTNPDERDNAPRDAEAFFDRFARVIDDAAGGLAEEQAATADPLLGQTVGQYRIDARLGEGGMGVVYRALDTRLNRVVALKFLPDHLNADARAKQRFLSEARAAAALDHPNICNIYEVNETEARRSFIAMAYYDGATLETLLENGPLPWPQAVDYAAQIARGLSAAHERGIVHRDVKPGNVMITANGVAKLLDFGIARSAEATRLTATGATIGTLAYMSPEQASGRPIDARTDLWSLGVLLYEMCTGARPFRGKTAPALLNAILNEQPPSAAKLHRELPSELDAVIARCLEKDPAARYLDASEVIADLTHVSSVQQPGAVLTRASRNWRVPAAIAGIVLAALIGTVVWRLTRAAPDVDPNRVAVLPFQQLAGPDSLHTFGDILAEVVTNGLMRTGLLSVTPAANVMTAVAQLDRTQSQPDLHALAQLTRAGLIVTGSYFVRGDSVSIQPAIFDVERDRALTPMDLLSLPTAEPLRAIDAVLQRVSIALSSHLDPRLSQSTPLADLPMSMPAYQEYLAGLERYRREDYKGALPHYYQALELDSTSAGLLLSAALTEWNANEDLAAGDSLLDILDRYKAELTPYDRARYDGMRAWTGGSLEDALRASRKMSELMGSPVPFHIQDAIRLNYLDEAERNVKAALEAPDGRINWNYSHYTHVLHARGDHRRELRQAQQSISELGETPTTRVLEIRALAALGKLEPLRLRLSALKTTNPTHREFLRSARELRWHGYTAAADTVGRMAARWYREALEKSPSIDVQLLLAETLFEFGDREAALRIFRTLAELESANTPRRRFRPVEVVPLGYLGLEAAQRGDTIGVKPIIERLRRLDGKYLLGSTYYWEARIVAQLGDCDRSVQLLREGLKRGSTVFGFAAEVPEFKKLECDAFKQLMAPK